VLFDDTVLDKNYAFALELGRSQCSGNAKAVIKGIGVVTCVYVNPETDQFWLIDYRIYDPEGDGKSKLDHARDAHQCRLSEATTLAGSAAGHVVCHERPEAVY
jgi:hypothetical protein